MRGVEPRHPVEPVEVVVEGVEIFDAFAFHVGGNRRITERDIVGSKQVDGARKVSLCGIDDLEASGVGQAVEGVDGEVVTPAPVEPAERFQRDV